jgi:hypothetical protein
MEQIQPNTSCLSGKETTVPCLSSYCLHQSNPFLRPPHPPSPTPSQSQSNTPPPHRRIHQSCIQTLIHWHRPHSKPATRPITHRQRILNREVRLALDGAQVEAQTALAARWRRGAEGRRWRCTCGDRHRHGDWVGGVEDWVRGVVGEGEESGCGEGGVGVCGCLGEAQVAFGEGGDEEGAGTVGLGMWVSDYQ